MTTIYRFQLQCTVVDNSCHMNRIRVCLHQVSVSMFQQLSDDTSNSVLIENNAFTRKWVATSEPHSGGTPLFSMATESLALLQSSCSIDADVWCKRPLELICSRCNWTLFDPLVLPKDTYSIYMFTCNGTMQY